jgi:hypothetical protein
MMPTVDEVQVSNTAAPDLESLRRLVEAGQVEEARLLASELADEWPDVPEVQTWAQVLAPPRVLSRTGPAGPPRDAERAWLKEHAREYPGCWIAVSGERLICAHRQLAEVQKAIREAKDPADPVLFFQPADSA